ncbi:hypothetical protein GS429_03365 [Natronorubrum sp. JWXQ-INN-674]|uniref:Uncharacterized protein n=1 Tax=Natronorubrum halalkaliphilum TaxID=2691917 RepID=A0A6B0VIL3_9EURY|nr:hypothetical protein [Natronorubrum halalkaliphilum]MXV61113.1 hypothetical protein [Natronorubrum halalkaliphilum]
MNCRFCNDAVPFTQHEMAHHLFELTDIDARWRLCRDCAEIRTEGTKYHGAGNQQERGSCIDCDNDAEYGITLLKETPAGDVVPDDHVYHVLCADHFDDRQH